MTGGRNIAVTITCFTVRYAETDQMGIVHHSNYPIWFEAGRTDYLKKAGVPNSGIEAKGILLPLTHMECRFVNPARYEDEITVKTSICRMTCVRIDFHYEIINQDSKLLAKGTTSHAWTDKQLNPFNIKKRFPELYMSLSSTVENDCNLTKNFRDKQVV